MKTKNIILLITALTLSVSAQNIPSSVTFQRATNSVSVTITEIYEQAQVMVQENGQLVPFPPTVRLVSRIVTTNAPIAAVEPPKPLLSAQRPPPKAAPAPVVKPPKIPPTLSGADTLELKTKIPATHVPSPPPSNSFAYVNWAIRNNVTNALPPNVPTNSPIFRRFSEWKKTLK